MMTRKNTIIIFLKSLTFCALMLAGLSAKAQTLITPVKEGTGYTVNGKIYSDKASTGKPSSANQTIHPNGTTIVLKFIECITNSSFVPISITIALLLIFIYHRRKKQKPIFSSRRQKQLK